MPTKKIKDLEAWETCTHREHNPPQHQYFSPGVYEHTCPACGHVQRFTVRRDWYMGGGYPHMERWNESTKWDRDVPQPRNDVVYNDGHELRCVA